MIRSISIVTVVCILSSSTFAQSFAERKRREAELEKTREVWEKLEQVDVLGDPKLEEGESALILFQEKQYHYYRTASQKTKKNVYRRRIKVLDEAAAQAYSVIYYPVPGEQVAVSSADNETVDSEFSSGVRLIKPNGTTINVNLPSLSVETEDVPSDWLHSEYGRTIDYRKVAIPQLEVGDIVDFFFWSESIYSAEIDVKIFNPKYVTLVERYPVLKQKIWLFFDEDHHAAAAYLNGAPEFKEITTEDDFTNSGRRKDGLRRYVLTDEGREENPDIHYNYPYANFPTVKFQAMYLTGKEETDPGFIIGQEGTLFTERPTYDKIKEALYNRVDDVHTFFKEKDVVKSVESLSSKAEQVKEAYKQYEFHRSYASLLSGHIQTVDDFTFLKEFSEILTRLEIPFNWFVTLPQHYGDLDFLILNSELKAGIYIEVEGEKFVLQRPDFLTDWSAHDYQNLGFSGYLYAPPDSEKPLKERTVSFEMDDSDDNVESTTLEIEVDVETGVATIKRKRIYTGIRKYIAGQEFLNVYDVALKRSNDIDYTGEVSWLDISGNNTDWKNYVTRNIKEDIGLTYDTLEFIYYKIVENGKTPEVGPMEIESKFTVGRAFKSGGDMAWIDMDELIDGQFRIDEDQRSKEYNREHTIYMYYPRSFEYNLEVTIPEGYEVINLDDFNDSTSTDVVDFVCEASMDQDIVRIKFRKSYLRYRCVPNEWANVVDPLEKAYHLSQMKLMLRRSESEQ